ncbi:MAG: Crp/Fnr family transcriptional regulator [Cellulosilyticum sp.]|nr:Crp/Fnr family transcriptional regulator [Cellulosilyticum sp.]
MLPSNHYQTLMQSALFRNISKAELISLLPCLNVLTKTYEPESIILTQGETVGYIYIILEGTVEIAKENFTGHKNIISLLSASNLFGEGVVCTEQRLSPVIATALTPVTLLLIPYERIVGGCEQSCTFHYRLIHNMMILLGEKNYHLNTKMELLLLKGMREKLATYLLLEARKQKTTSFTISLNRNQLADYLNVSRSSMCRELGRMQEEGIIEYYQNSFKILDEKRLHEALS